VIRNRRISNVEPQNHEVKMGHSLSFDIRSSLVDILRFHTDIVAPVNASPGDEGLLT